MTNVEELRCQFAFSADENKTNDMHKGLPLYGEEYLQSMV
jgi:hypothetical protein